MSPCKSLLMMAMVMVMMMRIAFKPSVRYLRSKLETFTWLQPNLTLAAGCGMCGGCLRRRPNCGLEFTWRTNSWRSDDGRFHRFFLKVFNNQSIHLHWMWILGRLASQARVMARSKLMWSEAVGCSWVARMADDFREELETPWNLFSAVDGSGPTPASR